MDFVDLIQQPVGELQLICGDIRRQLFHAGSADDGGGGKGLCPDKGDRHLGGVEVMVSCEFHIGLGCLTGLLPAVAVDVGEQGKACAPGLLGGEIFSCKGTKSEGE